MVRLDTKSPLLHVVEALNQEYCFPVIKSLPGTVRLATKASHHVTTVILIPFSIKELLHEGWGPPRPPHKVANAAPDQVRGLAEISIPSVERMPMHGVASVPPVTLFKPHIAVVQL